MSTYWQLLKDPRWQRKRLEIMERDGFTCQECRATDRTLNVHHKVYRKGAKPWEYDGTDLVCLCEDCHLSVTKTTRELREILGTLSVDDIEQVVGYVKGLRIAKQAFEDTPISAAPNAVRSAIEFEGMCNALSLPFLDAYTRLCKEKTSEADLRLAYETHCARPRPPRYEAS